LKVSDHILASLAPIPVVDMGERAHFIAYLDFMHGTMMASGPLLASAATRVDGRLRDYYAKHADEEKDHAAWLALDLAYLGHKLAPVPQYEAAMLAGAQYYYIRHVHPVMLLGYMAALEGKSTSADAVELLAQRYGEPAVRTIRYHSEHDPEHWRDLAAEIDAIEDQRMLNWISYNAINTSRTFCAFLERLKG